VAATTDNTAYVSTILDTANFDANELVLLLGSLADADVTFTSLFEEGDDSGLSDAAAVSSTNLLGTLAGTITAGAGSAFTPGFADDNTVRKIGYKGTKRYLRMTITPAANTGNIFMAAVWAQGNPRTVPQSTQGV
jgi:hypothetical protein